MPSEEREEAAVRIVAHAIPDRARHVRRCALHRRRCCRSRPSRRDRCGACDALGGALHGRRLHEQHVAGLDEYGNRVVVAREVGGLRDRIVRLRRELEAGRQRSHRSRAADTRRPSRSECRTRHRSSRHGVVITARGKVMLIAVGALSGAPVSAIDARRVSSIVGSVAVVANGSAQANAQRCRRQASSTRNLTFMCLRAVRGKSRAEGERIGRSQREFKLLILA